MAWKKSNVKIIVAVLAISLISVSIGYSTAMLTATTNYYLQTPLPICDYYIGQYSNSSYYAINGSNWANFLVSTNASYIFNTCLGNLSGNHQETVYANGNFSITNSIVIQKNWTNLKIIGKITAANALNAPMIRQVVDDVLYGVTIEGVGDAAVLDGNYAGQTSNLASGINFTRTTGSLPTMISPMPAIFVKNLYIRYTYSCGVYCYFSGSSDGGEVGFEDVTVQIVGPINIADVTSYGTGAVTFVSVYDSFWRGGLLGGSGSNALNYTFLGVVLSGVEFNPDYINGHNKVVSSDALDFSCQYVDNSENYSSLELYNVNTSRFHDTTFNSMVGMTNNTYSAISLSTLPGSDGCNRNSFSSLVFKTYSSVAMFKYGVNETDSNQDYNTYDGLTGTVGVSLASIKGQHSYIVDTPTSSASYIVKAVGTSYYLVNGTSGNIDFSSTNASAVLNFAIGNTTSGGLIQVNPGTYPLTTVVSVNVAGIRVVGSDEKSTVFSTTGNVGVFSITADNCSLENLCLKQTKTGVYPFPLYVLGADHILISEVEVANGNDMGIYVENSNYVTVQNCYVHDNQADHGILFKNSTDGRVLNCIVDSIGDTGIEAYSQSNNCVFYGNTVINAGNDAYAIQGSSGVTIDSCYAIDPVDVALDVGVEGADGAWYDCIGTKVVNCGFNATTSNPTMDGAITIYQQQSKRIDYLTIRNTGIFGWQKAGIYIGGTATNYMKGHIFDNLQITSTNPSGGSHFQIVGVDDLTISYSYSLNAAGYGVSLTSCVKPTISYNRISNVSKSWLNNYNGIGLFNCSNALVTMNKIDGSANQYDISIDSDCKNCSVLDNSLVGQGTGVLTNAGTSTLIKHNAGFVTENSFSGANTTATTAVINHGLAAAATYVWVSFNSSAITGYTWTSTATQVTITPSGTLPTSWVCYVKAEYVP